MDIEAGTCSLLSINAPEWFRQADFLEWLDTPNSRLFTWHEKGSSPDEFSDVIVLVDSSLSGEGSEEGSMPSQYWDTIISLCKSNFHASHGFHILVRITNLE